jgi:hypothetical protein
MQINLVALRLEKRMAGGSVDELGEAKTVSRGPAVGGRA